HQRLMCSFALGSLARVLRIELSVSVLCENPCLPAVAETNVQNFPQLRFRLRINDRRDDLDAFGEIPVHPICRSDEEIALGWIVECGREMENARVFQKSPDDGAYSNIFRASWNTWTEAAEPAHDQVDRHACGRCLADCFDQFRIF